MAKKLKGVSSVDTTNDYADLIQVNLLNLDASKILIWLKEEDTNAIKYKILGSQDDSRWEELKAETIIAKNGSDKESLTDAWLYLKVQHKASVADTQGKTSCIISGC